MPLATSSVITSAIERSGLSVVAIFLLAIPGLSYLQWLQDPSLAQENGVLEWLQVSMILFACVMHSGRAGQLDRSSLLFVTHAGLALLTYSFALRELDFEQFGSSPLWLLLEKSLRLIRTVLWLGFFMLMYFRMKVIFSQRAFLFRLPVVWMSLIGGLFLIAGGLFDRQVFSNIAQPSSRFAEEVLELNGYFMILAATFFRSATKPTAARVAHVGHVE
ncbi:MAG: hypothetical protein V4695_12225 [Pseudomonadota bacterium]